ncbi:unnamed protein product [Caenorhabditis auriculariae]|uniref:Uncharacterized protein n=1 Tax=Caenorhabditis auriculariae TaxID=2777116 RepID=A0A8S1HRS6_9PELO|nr:unnamed protein product [Caenorhabditis auriculariae]
MKTSSGADIWSDFFRKEKFENRIVVDTTALPYDPSVRFLVVFSLKQVRPMEKRRVATEKHRNGRLVILPGRRFPSAVWRPLSVFVT